jgi:hypothetical protein
VTRLQKVPTAGFSPYYGCAIMIAAVLVFGGMVGWSIYAFFAQDKTIAALTQDYPITLPPATLPAAAQADLEKRLAGFAAAATADQPAELKLSLPELNALLAMAPAIEAGGYAEQLRLIRTDPVLNTLSAQACLPMNRKFWEKGKRYLIGEVTFGIYDGPAGPDAKVVNVKVPGKTVEPGLINNMGIWPWLAPYQTGPLGEVLKKIRHAQVTPEGIALATQKR